ncbi:hypothetical protein IscW_ISCW013661 [Ixodes scapularis]|uniref:Uncharacterized protein n=1 Tax=Ixodes scapularis TaxID=6945 RepID=B7QIH2_IXOSC|nr:hypothetical protein IscW_ISCW013661 [Ixodes scapularis]|eukprot:XP_002414979.1 hypothetical protein IscW_ISCW013661 [Ixodes scapularis]
MPATKDVDGHGEGSTLAPMPGPVSTYGRVDSATAVDAARLQAAPGTSDPNPKTRCGDAVGEDPSRQRSGYVDGLC